MKESINKQELVQRLDRLDALFRYDESAALKEYKQWIRDLINLCTITQQAEKLREAIKLLHDFCDNTYRCEKCSIKDWCDKYCKACLPCDWEVEL